MKKKTIKIILITLGVTSGVFLMSGNTVFSKIPKNVKIYGEEVGGMRYTSAAALVREKIAESIPTLSISAPDGVYILSYPQISFTDNFYSVAMRAESGGDYPLSVEYYVKEAGRVAENICLQVEKEAKEAYAELTGGGFVYFEGENGVKCNAKKLAEDISSSVKGGFYPVSVSYSLIPPKTTAENLKEKTALIGSFTTCFDGANVNRAKNIALAASALNGKTVEGGGEFSFNSAVGTRSENRGYARAKIISGGKFVEGVGGGVCQVSTTLYNAALLAGMKISRVAPHSLSVSYVEPSFDAMVSYYNDFRFVNPTSYPVYIFCAVTENSVIVRLYGEKSDVKYVRISEVESYIEPEEELVFVGERDEVIIKAKRGVKSVGKLALYRGDEKLCEEVIRRDEYKSVRGHRTVKPLGA